MRFLLFIFLCTISRALISQTSLELDSNELTIKNSSSTWVRLHNTDGILGGGIITLRGSLSEILKLDAVDRSMKLFYSTGLPNTILKDGYIQLYNGSNNRTVSINSTGSASAPEIILYNNSGTEKIKIDADLGGDSRITTDELEIKGGSDLAEHFNPSGNEWLRPGSVVCIDEKHEGALRLSVEANEKGVIGVVSGANGIKPGMLMGQEETLAHGNIPVALVGRVYVLADATYGEIRPGDLLTSSDTPGHAMRVRKFRKAQGAILGKALTTLKEGRGYVLVLIALQ